MSEQSCRVENKLQSKKSVDFWKLSFTALFLATLTIRLACLSRVPLSGDEAYYWLWSKHPAAGYFDHPPMVAWLIAALTSLGDNEITIRMGAILCSVGMVLFLCGLARRLGGGSWRASFMSCAPALLAPFFSIYSFIIYPDAPLLFFWSGFMYFFYRAFYEEKIQFWTVAGFFLGMACLSKFMAVFLIVGLFAFLVFSEKGRRMLCRSGPYQMLSTALVILFPFLWWNAHHGWETFLFQLAGRH